MQLVVLGYTILNLPGGLQFTPGNGQVTGTPTVAGLFPVSIIVNYSDDDGNLTDADSDPDQLGSLFAPENPGDREQVILSLTVDAIAPTVSTSAASEVNATKASFNGNVTSTGGDAPDIRIYYGLTDGGNTASSWTFVKEIGKKGGTFGEVIGDLLPNTTYYYRVRAFNSAATEGVWAASSVSLTTLTSNAPVVNNGSILNATGTSVTFKAGVTSFGTGTLDLGSSTFTADRYPNLKLWLDANDLTTLDKGFDLNQSGQPADTNPIGYWQDKSGTEHHAKVYQSNNNYRPSYRATGMNGKPTIQFDGSNDYMLLENGRTDFHQWDKFTFVIAYQDWGSANWRRVMGNVDHQTGGWCLAWNSGSQFRFRIIGTSGGDDRTFGGTRAQTHLISGVYTGAVRWGYVDGQYQTMTDTGVLPNNPNADFVIGGCGRDLGTPGGASKIRMSEVLIFKDALSGDKVDKLEGYLAHKWSLTNRLRGGHPYASTAPTFTDPVSAVDLTLYWGSIDGGENPANWEQEVDLGRYYNTGDIDGFNAYGYQTTWRNESYLKNMESMLQIVPDQSVELQGNSRRNGQLYWNGDADFYGTGLLVDRDNNNYEDNFMTLFTTRFKPPTTGNYVFNINHKDDRIAIWLDRDQDGVFEGGSVADGANGNELLNPNENINYNGNMLSLIHISEPTRH